MSALARETVVRRLGPTDYRVMPWKNGLGSTAELVVDPPETSLDDFAWRVSIATVTASGPFSCFPGCDRVILALDGAAVTLRHAGQGAVVLAPVTPHRFDGEALTHCELAGDFARDFNVITRRARAHADVLAAALAAGDSRVVPPVVNTRLVYVHHGEVTVNTGPDAYAVGAEHALVISNPGVTTVHARESSLVVVVSVALRT